ncbi:hypothetical protein A8E62_12090 [Burkholderia cenocepacia]|nr:hypothetical protein A8E62_12090 [Burkholderia cenocepacia]ONU92819.1 hypothetical protein A8E63_08575 [Burkholderia cenocepacia]
MEAWTKDRRDELGKLQELVRQIGTLNSGSGAIDRLQRIMILADDLAKADLDNGRLSFVNFLVELSASERARAGT